MLSNPPNGGLHARNRQHRRQNSTPVAYGTVKLAPNLANIRPSVLPEQPQPQVARLTHRRGMSLDTRRQMLTERQQEFNVVSNTNNTGLANPPQHVVREARQQRIARPGPQQAYANLAADQSYLVSPGATPQIPCFEWPEDLSNPNDMSMVYGMYNGSMSTTSLKKSQDGYSSDLGSTEFDIFEPSGPSTPTLAGFENNHMATAAWLSETEDANSRRTTAAWLSETEDANSRRAAGGWGSETEDMSSRRTTATWLSETEDANSRRAAAGWGSETEDVNSRRTIRRISNGLLDRLQKYDTLSNPALPRPSTPPQPNEADYFPLTPMETPQSETFRNIRLPQRFTEGYDGSNEETVKPIRQRGNRQSTTFDEMRMATEALTIAPEAPHDNSMQMPVAMNSGPTPVLEYLAATHQEATDLRIDANSDVFQPSSYAVSECSDYSRHMTPGTPGLPEMGSFDYIKSELDQRTDASDVPSSSRASSPAPHNQTIRSSRHRRTESIASLASAASIASIDIESTKMTTGITLEDIQQYIQGPDAKDNKWVCVFENCNKKFGRKENIKSHVQTHLNDRQYKCPECAKCFVRQHDLKRHAKIHTGIKPYPCACGNSFARHDALTRHRQRGMCIGAFEGSSPKNAKRGRPRKPRPDNYERRDKATRTRRRNQSTSVSSRATCSDYSAATSPEDQNDDFDMMDEIMDVSIGGTTMNPSNLQSLGSSSAPMPTLAAEEALNMHSPPTAANVVHPQAQQYPQVAFRAAQKTDTLSPNPDSPAVSANTSANDPPELSHIASPPTNQYFDTEPGPSELDLMMSTAPNMSTMPNLMSMAPIEHGLLLECEPQMMMFGSEAKFEDTYDGVDMFTNNDDLIFGHS